MPGFGSGTVIMFPLAAGGTMIDDPGTPGIDPFKEMQEELGRTLSSCLHLGAPFIFWSRLDDAVPYVYGYGNTLWQQH